MSDLAEYSKAMRDGNCEKCLRIEAYHNLEGYTPELVSVGLRALGEGKDAHLAIAEYMNKGAKHNG